MAADRVDRPLVDLPLEQIVARFQEPHDDAGRSEAAREVLIRFEPLLRKYFLRVARSGLEYDDFVQDVMVRLIIALPRLNQPKAFPGLLHRIVIGVMTDMVRKREPPRVELNLELLEEQLAVSFDEAISLELAVRSMLERMPPSLMREVLRRVLEGQDIAAIAAELGLTESTVRMYKSRAISNLRDLIDP